MRRVLSLALAAGIAVSSVAGGVPAANAARGTAAYSETDLVPESARVPVVPPSSRGRKSSIAVPGVDASITAPSDPAPVQLLGRTVLRETERRELEQLSTLMENNSLRYLHTTWWLGTYTYQSVVVTQSPDASSSEPATSSIEVLVPPGGFSAGEVPIRRQASALYATSLALSNGSYNASRVGVSRAEALRRTVAWTNALALSYQQDGWAHGWQSGLWVYYLGMGAKQVWSSLPTSTQELVRAAVVSEADFRLTQPPLYYRDAAGNVTTPGYSKGPEDAWNANLLYLAAREFADDPSASSWEGQARWYSLVAYATPSQVGLDPRIAGSNLNADGTITNHKIIHPDYALGEGEAVIKYKLVAADTKTGVASEGLNNRWAVWRGLTSLWFPVPRFPRPGGTIYRSNAQGHAIADMYYPQGTDWSYSRRFNAALTDIVNFADNVDSKAYSWARQHCLFTLGQQARHPDGKIFSPGETNFAEEEQYAAACAAESVELLVLARSNAPFSAGYNRRAAMRRTAQLWNSSIGTRRYPPPRKGGIVNVTGPVIVRRGLKYVPISWAGTHAGWVRYDYIRWL